MSDEKFDEKFDDTEEIDDADRLCDSCGGADVTGNLPRQRVRVRKGRDVQEVYLCPECAALWGIGADDPGLEFRVADLFFPTPDDEDPELQCPRCNRSLTDIRMTGRVGCAECYATFTKDIILLIHGTIESPLHTGRIPENLQSLRAIIHRQTLRKDRIHQALAQEDYEEAARIRDEQEPMDD
ncbi:MAG: hypothetical protein GW949_04975 [Spirochaetales bacterium]|nr:hypothetical protein [Spirochaetales bacterium]